MAFGLSNSGRERCEYAPYLLVSRSAKFAWKVGRRLAFLPIVLGEVWFQSNLTRLKSDVSWHHRSSQGTVCIHKRTVEVKDVDGFALPDLVGCSIAL